MRDPPAERKLNMSLPGPAGAFRIKRGRVGCLLLHGLTGTPYEMRGLGDALASAGISVLCPLLPGHGTSPEDLDKTRWPEWEAASLVAFDELGAETDVQFVCGLSLGGTLAIRVAARRKAAGLIVLSPALKLRSPLVHLLPVLSRLIRFRGKTSDIKDPVALARHPGYKVQSLAAANSLRDLMRRLPKDYPALRLPLLAIVSKNDHVVDPEAVRAFHRDVPSDPKRLVMLDDCYHVITVDREAERVKREVVDFVRNISGV